MTLLLDLESLQIPVDVSSVAEMKSKHTGNALRVLHVTFEGENSNECEEIERQRVRSGPFVVSDEKGSVLGRFKPGNCSYSYSDRSPVSQHAWELIEIEDLHLGALVLGNELTLVPYEYEEKYQDDTLDIQAKVRLSDEEEKRLRALPLYFPVVRKGINDAPCEMRLGQIVWSKNKGEPFKVRLILVDRKYDKTPPFGLMEPQFGNAVARLMRTDEVLRRLLTQLKVKGVLSDSECTEVNKIPDEQLKERDWELFRVQDVDKWE